MNTKRLTRLFALTLIAVIVALGLCSCTMTEDTTEARKICEDYIDAVIDNDFAAAYGLFDEIATREQFKDVWDYTIPVFENSKSYELKQTGWHSNTEGGVTLRQVSYELVTDDGKTVYLSVALDDEGLYGFNVVDSTEFIANTEFLRVIGVIMTVVSIALFGVTIWMIVDACKRNIRHKLLWILLIVIGVWFEVAVGIEAGYFDFDFGLFFGIKTATAYTLNQIQAIGVRFALPIGTIIYFFIRKSLSAREEAIAAREAAEAEAKAAAEAEQAALAEKAVESEAAEEAPTEEPAEEKAEENNEDQ